MWARRISGGLSYLATLIKVVSRLFVSCQLSGADTQQFNYFRIYPDVIIDRFVRVGEFQGHVLQTRKIN